MKKTIISIILSLIVATVAAQTNQYPGTTGTITKSGYTYKYRNLKIHESEIPSILVLYNAANPYLDVNWRHRDGTPLTPEEIIGNSPNSEYFNSNQTIAQTLAMVNGLFTSQQKAQLRGKFVFIELKIDSSTGRIADVYFRIERNGPFANIPVETYRSIEQSLKQNLTFTVTAKGRKMNYLQLSWPQEF